MEPRVRIEIRSRNDFWRNAFFVEWEHQFPDRQPEAAGQEPLLVPAAWLDDMHRVAAQCFSEIRVAPSDPGRRQVFRRLFSAFEK